MNQNEHNIPFPGYGGPFDGEQAPGGVLPTADEFASLYEKDETTPQRPIKLLIGVIGTGNGGKVWIILKPMSPMISGKCRTISRNDPNCRGKTV